MSWVSAERPRASLGPLRIMDDVGSRTGIT